jgi:hypothetical protein
MDRTLSLPIATCRGTKGAVREKAKMTCNTVRGKVDHFVSVSVRVTVEKTIKRSQVEVRYCGFGMARGFSVFVV